MSNEPSDHHRPSLTEEVQELEHTAEEGKSEWTPFILLGGVWIACGIAVVLLLGIAGLAYWLAS
jgi:hypothetical protein